MTQDEIIEMARQVWGAGGVYVGPSIRQLTQFAELVAAAERERLHALAGQGGTLMHRCKAAGAYHHYLEPGEAPVSDVKIVQVHAASQGRSS